MGSAVNFEQFQGTIRSICEGKCSDETAEQIYQLCLQALAVSDDPEKRWAFLSRHLSPDIDFQIHKQLHQLLFASWDESKRPAPVWIPSPEIIENANLTRAFEELGFEHYEDFHRWSVTHRREFWQWFIEKIRIRFAVLPDAIVSIGNSLADPVWLPNARLNIVESCFQASADQLALLCEREDGKQTVWEYEQLQYWTQRIAASLRRMGMKPGEYIGICMPLNQWAVALYLGAIAAGAVVVAIADSLAPEEIRRRMEIAGAEIIFTQDITVRAGKVLPLYEKIQEAGIHTAIVLPFEKPVLSLRAADFWFDTFLHQTEFEGFHFANPMDPITVLFSSGTTGEPKAIPWNHTTPLRCAADAFFHHDIHPEHRLTWPTNLGWMMGPWLIFASLLNRAAIVLYEGAPTSREFCAFVQRTEVSMLGVVPSLVRRWRELNALENIRWNALRLLSSTGEASSEDDYFWLMVKAGYRPVIEYCGGTEIGGGYITGTVLHPAVPATFTTPSVALDFVLLDDMGHPSDRGEVFIVPPSIGLSTTLLNRDHFAEYYADTPAVTSTMTGALGTPLLRQYAQWEAPPLLRRHGDEMERLPGWYYRAHGRTDDTMNLGGIKVSSIEIERVLNAIEGVKETAAIAVSPPGGGPQQLVIYAVVDRLCPLSEWKEQFQSAIRNRLNPLFHIADVRIVENLPRTASNKIMRRVLRRQYLQEIERGERA